MRLQFLLLRALGLFLCYTQLVFAVDASYELVEQLDKAPDGWSRGDKPPASKFIKFRLAIAQHNAREFEQKVIELSTPEHPSYATPEKLAAGCDVTITPDCLRDLYKIDNTTTRPDWRNRLGISGFLEQYARHDDFNEFLRRYAQSHTDANFSVVSINGGQDGQHSMSDSVEANLDVQYSIPLADEVLATFYSTGGRGPVVPEITHPDPTESSNEPYLEQLHYLLDLPDEELPAVLSNSFLPGYPASCPFVTAVGGTYGTNPEKAVPFSGGGFSEVFSRPQYQDQAVKGYLGHLGNQWNGLYNATGRGYPDISAQAANFIVRDQGDWISVGGTSASTPVLAGVISRLNAARIAQGKPRMGFLNPWLYSHGQTGFTDIVLGSSSGCKWTSDARVRNASWDATEGWDPATGLGTPLFPALVKLVLSDGQA
ncbi:vesicle formation at the endoplasmic reticulum [Penicillium rubens]|nr:vesicle formation at the endoplasmic reticulum [Penicillium rubens]